MHMIRPRQKIIPFFGGRARITSEKRTTNVECVFLFLRVWYFFLRVGLGINFFRPRVDVQLCEKYYEQYMCDFQLAAVSIAKFRYLFHQLIQILIFLYKYLRVLNS